MKVFLPGINEVSLEAAKLQFELAFSAAGFTEAPNECALATLSLNVILGQLDPIVAACITIWANDPTLDTVTLPMTYKKFHQEIVHLLVRLAFVGGWVEGQAAMVDEAMAVLGDLEELPEFKEPPGDPSLN